MPQIRVERNNIVVGAINSFEVGGFQIGATTGEVTVRREIEFFDVDVEQAFGTIRKSPVTDKRFLAVSTAEASLQNLLNAWNDDQQIGGAASSARDSVLSQKSAAAAQFGQSEGAPLGLANDGNRILMIGGTAHTGGVGRRLYSVDSLGRATIIKGSGAGNNFGVSGGEFWGATYHGGRLYTVSNAPALSLYTVATTGVSAGDATIVGTALGASITGVRGLASDGTNLWVAGSTSSQAKLYAISASAGSATAVGSGNFGSGVNAARTAGLAYGGGKLFVVAAVDSATAWALYEVNTSTSALTRIGSATNFGLSTDASIYGTVTPGGMTYFDGQLWLADSEKDGLIRINPATGVAVEVGDIDTLYMNNMPTGALVSEIEKPVKIIVPGPNDRYRAYKFNRCVSVTPAEHMYQKNGLTMVPYEFEVLVDPSSAQGHYGIIRDFPLFADADAF